jgi:hypothetical protein
MKAKVAVETVQGKVYFLIVNKLKEKYIPFISLIPGETEPAEVKVVITTDEEKHQINHENVVVYDSEKEPGTLVNDVAKILEGKEAYEKITIGVDPGEVFGLAVLSDGKVSETENCLSIQEVLNKTKNIMQSVDFSSTNVSIRIGNGIPVYKELLEILDAALPPEVVLEVVIEAGTNRPFKENKHRRELKDIASAIQIAGRTGFIYQRRKNGESNV